MNAVLEVRNLDVRYEQHRVLEDITFSVQRGEYIGIVGPNGSGKSTLIKSLLNLVPSAAGGVTWFSVPLNDFRQWSRIGYLPQMQTFSDPRFPATVEEVVLTGLMAGKTFPRRYSVEDREKLGNVLEMLDIAGLRKRTIGRLSGGQQQRVLLARAMVANPEVLLLDEPSSALDPKTREGFYEVIRKINEEQNITIMLVSHDTGSIGAYAKKLLYLDRKLVFFDTFAGFCKDPKMSLYFGRNAQHLICHQHDHAKSADGEVRHDG